MMEERTFTGLEGQTIALRRFVEGGYWHANAKDICLYIGYSDIKLYIFEKPGVTPPVLSGDATWVLINQLDIVAKSTGFHRQRAQQLIKLMHDLHRSLSDGAVPEPPTPEPQQLPLEPQQLPTRIVLEIPAAFVKDEKIRTYTSRIDDYMLDVEERISELWNIDKIAKMEKELAELKREYAIDENE